MWQINNSWEVNNDQNKVNRSHTSALATNEKLILLKVLQCIISRYDPKAGKMNDLISGVNCQLAGKIGEFQQWTQVFTGNQYYLTFNFDLTEK